MSFAKTYIPYGGYWSSPFSKWQGSFANEHAIELAARTAKKFFSLRDISPDRFDNLFLGHTIPQPMCFYGGPWIAALLGNDRITGPIISQACITGVVCVKLAAQDIDDKVASTSLVITTDRCSNGPHLYYPSQVAPGATGKSEDWVLDNFGYDPYAKNSMIQTAENVVAEEGFTKDQQDEITQRRYEQYQMALADDCAFQKRYMIPVEIGRGKKVKTIESDEGIFPTTLEGLKALRPVLPEGTVTFGSQTHPADGNAGMVVTTQEFAKEMSTDKNVTIQFIGFDTARTKKGYMAAAMVPAAQAALDDAGIKAADVNVVKTHNPFAVNDLNLAAKLGFDLQEMNNYGSSLIFGHPQAPTALRIFIELIEELVIKGGGYGLFAGCAAGDTAAGAVVKVS